MTTFNLLAEAWLPVLRRDGAELRKTLIAPWQIAETGNPIVALAASRPDFNGALIQFLIGLLQTAYAPKDWFEWKRRFDEPPTPEELREAFHRYRHAFDLDGDGPRFMQDLDPLAGQKPLPITALLIDTAGSETHFIKNLPQLGLSPALAALALYTLQSNAPAGGVGHRTSLRGGGPLSTLVMAAPENPGTPAPLWQTLWLNVLEDWEFQSSGSRDQDIFPWLGPTRTSEKTGKTPITTPEDVHPLQMFWGMPRRIRLDFEDMGQGECGLSGQSSGILVKQYRTRNYGTNYGGGAWQHTLSPHSRESSTGELVPLHPRGSIHYRHWLGVIQKATADKKTERGPARVVNRFLEKDLGYRKRLRFQVWAFGYDMDSMKPRCWYEGTMPLFQSDDPERRQRFEKAVENLIRAGGEFLGNLRSCLKDAWFDPKDHRRTNADMGFLDAAFWPETEGHFYNLLECLRPKPADEATRKEIFRNWHGFLNGYTQEAFHRHTNTGQIAEQNPKRIARAFRRLRNFNFKKDIKVLLEMPL